MNAPKIKPLAQHIDKPAERAARDAELVRQMLDSEPWRILMESVDDRLRYEQQLLMSPVTIGNGDERYERKIGEWNGMQRVAAIAEGIVRYGDAADRKLQEAAA